MPPMPTKVSNLEDFLVNKASVPLALSKVKFGVIETECLLSTKRKETTADYVHQREDGVVEMGANELYLGQDYMSSARSFFTTPGGSKKHHGEKISNIVPDSMGSTVPDLVKRLTDKIVGAVNELVLLHHDLYTHPGKAHSLSVDRCGVCRELEEAIQVGVDATFSRGVVVGKKSGVATIREMVGVERKKMRLYTFKRVGGNTEAGHLSGRMVPVTVESMRDRKVNVAPTLVSDARDTWKLVEDQVKEMMLFQLRSIIGVNESDVDEEDGEGQGRDCQYETMSLHHIHTLEDRVTHAIRAGFRVGEYHGYHSGQSRFKSTYGIEGDWIYTRSSEQMGVQGVCVWSPRKVGLKDLSKILKRRKG